MKLMKMKGLEVVVRNMKIRNRIMIDNRRKNDRNFRVWLVPHVNWA